MCSHVTSENMAAFKTKVKSFFSGFQLDKGPSDADKSADDHAMEPMQLPSTREDLRRTDEIISEIDEVYFREGDSSCQYELQQLGPDIDVPALEDRIFTLKTQDNAIYRKIYDLVFANYTEYVQELENVTMLQLSLQHAASTCIGARRQLRHAKEGVSHGGLGLLSKHRRRERLRALLEILQTLKTLQRTDAKLKELLQEGDYPAATRLCLECQNVIETYKQYTCVNELAVSLQDIQSDIEESVATHVDEAELEFLSVEALHSADESELEGALGKVCTCFKAHSYEQVQEAYRVLGKTQTAVDTLLMKFTTTIHDSTYGVVAEYVKRGDDMPLAEAQNPLKMPYSNLCKLIRSGDFIQCLLEICQIVWRVMHSYHQVKVWHDLYDVKSADSLSEYENQAEISFNRNYVKTKLANGLLRVWRDVQQKVKPYILAIDMSGFKYDDFIRVLDIVNKLIAVGVEFSGEGSDSLQESMRQQSLKYFKNFHRARLDELKIFLETEAWESCPVRSTFTVHKLREFRFLRSLSSPSVTPVKSMSPSRTDDASLFSQLTADDNPFAWHEEEEEGEDVMDPGGLEDTMSDDDRNYDEDEEDDELRKAYVDEQTGDSRQLLKVAPQAPRPRSASAPKGPILANTTLTVIRFFGNYIQMMSVLRPIAFDVLECLSQLFDYYLYAVYKFFATDLLELQDDLLSTKLMTSLKRISELLLFSLQDSDMGGVIQTADGSVKVSEPAVNPVVDLLDCDTLFGFRYRMVAVESLVFLAAQFEYLVVFLDKLIPDSKRSFLTQFLSHTVKTSQELRKPVYYGIASKAIAYDQVLHQMSGVKWDVKEIMSQHSSYVDVLLQEFTKFKHRQYLIGRSVHIPPQAYNMLWESAVILSNRTFVDGFSLARKCSNEGRALMQLDFQQYRTQLEKMSGIRPLPNHAYVEDYIKAYYLSEKDTEEWLKKHQEYSARQLQPLVLSGIGSRINKRSRQKLLAIIEENKL